MYAPKPETANAHTERFPAVTAKAAPPTAKADVKAVTVNLAKDAAFFVLNIIQTPGKRINTDVKIFRNRLVCGIANSTQYISEIAAEPVVILAIPTFLPDIADVTHNIEKSIQKLMKNRTSIYIPSSIIPQII